eukprot:CAMPEP_0204126752 /NCGR_PEP_ID=MMETSP0361-20130328/11194_1 /ASSEMBLY_ACC=CAM_ASM_000343 /TAXON_ID=268821 /ORGANISM="Scrippsiella Hangoei, Strain SHTV-5" /LENGTH=30 /DNA_ID= /DNA_START= /DNA_END= /DNA_ORIENTATION=
MSGEGGIDWTQPRNAAAPSRTLMGGHDERS